MPSPVRMACLGYKRETDRPRCPGTAPSLSDSWSCQEPLPRRAQAFWQRRAAQRRPVSLPTCQPHPRRAQRFAPFFPCVQQAPAPSLLLASSLQSQPASLSLPPGIQTLQPILPGRGLGPINLWTNVKESGGGATFQVPRPEEQIKPDVCRPARTPGPAPGSSSCQHNQPGRLNLRLSFRGGGGFAFLPACPDRPQTPNA